jgi:hypothetical protein
MFLTAEDIAFISKLTNLSHRKTRLLSEEPRDLILILNAVSDFQVTKRETNAISFDLMAKFAISRFVGDRNIGLDEQLYVSELVAKYFPLIIRGEKLRTVPKNENDKEFAEYAFILIGLFSHKIAAGLYSKYRQYLFLFRSEYPELYEHIEDWIYIFNQMKSQEIFV